MQDEEASWQHPTPQSCKLLTLVMEKLTSRTRQEASVGCEDHCWPAAHVQVADRPQLGSSEGSPLRAAVAGQQSLFDPFGM